MDAALDTTQRRRGVEKAEEMHPLLRDRLESREDENSGGARRFDQSRGMLDAVVIRKADDLHTFSFACFNQCVVIGRFVRKLRRMLVAQYVVERVDLEGTAIEASA